MTIKTFDAFSGLSTMNINRISNFLYENLGQYKDSMLAIRNSVKYAAKELPGLGGYVFVMRDKDDIYGVLVLNRTGMNEYLSENIIVYVAVKEGYRKKGIGKKLIEHAVNYCNGDISIHVKNDNPAINLFKKVGFKPRNIEMRLER